MTMSCNSGQVAQN